MSSLRVAGTFKEGCDVPCRDPSLLHELSQCDLQEEDRDAPNEDDQQVRDQENPCNTQHTYSSHAGGDKSCYDFKYINSFFYV